MFGPFSGPCLWSDFGSILEGKKKAEMREGGRGEWGYFKSISEDE